jgi:lysophospholipase L1-like esterase
MKKPFLAVLGLLLGTASIHAATHTAHLIGDSTVSLYASNLFPRMGWGQVFGNLFNSSGIAVNDKALSGRSSKSFYDEGAWTPVYNALKAGDYVFIQFGHNDEKTDANLHTDPYTTYEQYLTYYINATKAKGAFPVLVTPVERNGWSSGKVKASHGNYPDAMRQLAVAKGVPLIDLTARSTAKYQSLGQTYTTNSVFMNLTAGQFPNYPNGNADNTHFQQNGANIIAKLVTDGIRADPHTQMKTLATYLK